MVFEESVVPASAAVELEVDESVAGRLPRAVGGMLFGIPVPMDAGVLVPLVCEADLIELALVLAGLVLVENPDLVGGAIEDGLLDT